MVHSESRGGRLARARKNGGSLSRPPTNKKPRIQRRDGLDGTPKSKTPSNQKGGNLVKNLKNGDTSAPPSTSTPHKQLSHSQPTIPFDPDDKILLIGEGDFSFAESLVFTHHCTDIIATTFESQETLEEKYAGVEERTIALIESEMPVMYNVDATKLDKIKRIVQKGPFDRVLFNFPHVGGVSTDVNRQVRANQAMLVAFLEACKPLLCTSAAKGSIVITLFEGEPYTLWNIKDLARSVGLGCERSWAFQASAFPEYRHARTMGDVKTLDGEVSSTAWRGEERPARCFEFVLREKIGRQPAKGEGKKAVAAKKRKRGEKSDDEDGVV